MAYRYKEDGSVERSYKTSDGTVGWASYPKSRVPEAALAKLDNRPVKPPSPTQSGRTADAWFEKHNLNKGKEWDDAAIQGEAAIMRKKEAQDMGPIDSTMIHAGREVDKLLAGSKDIGLAALAALGIDTGEARAKIAAEQADNDRVYKELDDESFGSKAGAMLPYMVTGLAEPVISKAIGQGLKSSVTGLGKGIEAIAAKAGGTGGKLSAELAKKYAHVPLPPKIEKVAKDLIDKTKKKFSDEIVDPLKGVDSRLRNREPLETPRAGFRSRIAGSAALGGLEGAAHYDESALEGMGASVLGTAAGLSAKNKLSRSYNYNTPSENATLKKWKDEYGYRPIPGEETGKVEIQQISNNMRTDEKFASGMRVYDRSNLQAVSRQAALASGMSGSDLRDITRESLSSHIQSLKNRFQSLEEVSSGPVNIDDFDSVIKNLDDHPALVQKHISSAIEEIGDSIDGKTYKQIRSKLKGFADSAAKRDDPSYGIYKDTIDGLDTAMKNAIGDTKGPEVLAKWKELREQYAMTHFMIENGMDANHGIDMGKVSRKLMSTDAKRLLTGEGGTIGKFHDIAKLSAIQSKQAGGGLGRDNIDNVLGDSFKGWGLLSTPGAGDMGPFRAARFGAYMNGWPNRTGLLNLPRNGIRASENVSRAAQQGNDYMTSPAISAYDWLQQKLNDEDKQYD